MRFKLCLILAIFLFHATDQDLNHDDDTGVLIYMDLGVVIEPVSYEESVGCKYDTLVTC